MAIRFLLLLVVVVVAVDGLRAPRRESWKMAMDLDISETSPHLQRIWILLLLLSLWRFFQRVYASHSLYTKQDLYWTKAAKSLRTSTAAITRYLSFHMIISKPSMMLTDLLPSSHESMPIPICSCCPCSWAGQFEQGCKGFFCMKKLMMFSTWRVA